MARIFMKGTEAIAEAAVRAGCRFFAGYPITPQNEIPEYLARRMPEVGGTFVQGESEVASINMVYGAAGTGTRALAQKLTPSLIRLMPQEEELVMARVPVPAAPYTILMDATSLSPCTKLPPTSGSRRARYSGISFCGVIG